MSASTSGSTLKLAALTLSLIASVLGSSAAHAYPRLLARDVRGDYDMQDGSTLRIDVVGRRVLVESSAPEDWTAANANLLVSPDGLRKIRLFRDFDGRVDRIEMEITSAR
jgi:predicted RNA-binding protein